MQTVRETAPQLSGLVPYDPKYLPAEFYLSANENPNDVPSEVRAKVREAIDGLQFNRYPDPLANELRDKIAAANGLSRENILLGNGGDELLFNTALAWGGPGRTFLNFPPTFSVYAANARLTLTDVVDIPRLRDKDFALDEAAILEYLRCGGQDGTPGACDFMIITSPNNPTGGLTSAEFIEQVLEATDALVMVDEAYFEFAGETVLPLLQKHKNLLILRTFSKAYSLAGVRIGYIMAHADVINEYLKVRQPYSVDAVSQAIAGAIYDAREAFEPGVEAIKFERARMFEELGVLDGLAVYPSDSNWLLVEFISEGPTGACSGAGAGASVQEGAAVGECPDADKASCAWQYLYDRGVLVRDFSQSKGLEGCLRITIGTTEENNALLAAVKEFLSKE
jgi:histidinol-phosphate aminotransferase